MKRLLLLLLSILIGHANLKAQVKDEGIPFIRNYGQKEYNASAQNWAAVQDHRGVMYFGNNYGVLEYDGNNWRVIILPNRTIARSLAIGKDGTIYVGGQNDFGYLSPNRQGLMEFVSLKDQIPEADRSFDDVWKTYVTSDGVYFCTVQAIYLLRNNKFDVYRLPELPWGFPFYVRNTLYVPVPEKGLYEISAGKMTLIPNSDVLKGYTITGILPHHKAGMLLVTNQGKLFAYDGYNHFTAWKLPVSPFLEEARINTVMSFSNGLAFGTAHNGLLLTDKDGTPRQHLNIEKGLQNNAVRSIYEDDAGNLWLGLNNGISYVETNSAFTHFNAYSGLPGTAYTSLLDSGKVYLGTSDGLYFKQWSNSENPIQPAPFRLVEHTQGQVYNLQKIRNRLLLAHHEGPYQVKNGVAERLSDHRGAWLFLPLKAHPDYLLCGTYNGLLLYKFEGDNLKFVRTIEGFSESSRVMEEDEAGNIWIAHGYKGIYRLKLSDDLSRAARVDFYGQASGFPSNIFINVFKINGELVFTGERGVFTYNKRTDKFEDHPVFSKLFAPDVHIRKLVEDSDGHIWFSAGKEVGVLKKKANGSFEVEKNIFNKLYDKLVGGFEHIAHYDRANMLIGTDEGFVHYHPTFRQTESTDHTFHTLIRQVSATDGATDSLISGGDFLHQGQLSISQPAGLRPELPYTFNSVKFTYSGVTFLDNDHVQYQFMLEGFDRNWSGWGTSKQKEYTNLPEGTYTFKVKARDVYGHESGETAFTFTILPAWYSTYWAKAVYFLLGLLAIWLLKRLIDRRVRLQQGQLREEQEKALRLKEAAYIEEVLKAEKEVIRLNNEKLESELEHKSKELASSAMHVMQSLETIDKVRGQLQTVMEQVEDRQALHQLRKVLRSVEEDIKVENNWDQFELHFNQLHQGFLKRLRHDFPDLTHRDIKLCAYLRMNLTSKEIASLLNLSLRGVETSRYRLRKKLNLEQEVNLTEFILKY
ncbi:ligand-binding sensor domain-containing protein [Pontibacter chinhatensis]|uniref:Two component regulator propeller n=1 Tax=Pontibacter chinhatensis TaxID=1436961 RepID=A0A1I2QZD4_9BACT|nr:two-component regulator propeller domain-containing protein [Pontibacter chinhatensis]SFG33662.1 Two component regulator propeller [Pontibacter chinhatensis]